MTDPSIRTEQALGRAVDRLTADGCPPRLGEAIRYAVFPAGNRLRPQLCLAVADALNAPDPVATDAAATALELLHCASLVQDDLPAFDHADLRRGRPSLYRVFGEGVAILAADALIIGAFDEVGRVAHRIPDRAGLLLRTVSRGVGSPFGAVAGQAWEAEATMDLAEYHRSKTAALFEAVTAAGAIVAGQDPEPWRPVGQWLGRAYQLADDIADEGSDRTSGPDGARGRPNAVQEFGATSSAEQLERCIGAAMRAVPDCDGEVRFRRFLHSYLDRFRLPTTGSEGRGLDQGTLVRHLRVVS
jgi:geranylgeranyl diphosphate synthase type II